MGLRPDPKFKGLYASSVVGLTVLGVVNYLSYTPLKFIASGIGLVLLVYAVKKMNQNFGVPLGFAKRENLNYWSGAFAGVLTMVIMAIFISTNRFEKLNMTGYVSEVGLFTIYTALILTLFMGAVLQDVEDGYIDL